MASGGGAKREMSEGGSSGRWGEKGGQGGRERHEERTVAARETGIDATGSGI